MESPFAAPALFPGPAKSSISRSLTFGCAGDPQGVAGPWQQEETGLFEEILVPQGIRSLPLDPRIQTTVEARRRLPANHEIAVEAAKKRFLDARLPPAGGYNDGILTEDRTIPGDGGPVPVRIYRDAAAPAGPLPILVYFHGGGFVLGNLDTHDIVCRAFARARSLVVMSVDYRLAPEHPYPAAIDDGVAALRFAAESGAEIGGDPARIVLGGDSAGGMLTLATALRAREAGGPAIRALVPFYPMADLVDIGSYPSYAAYGDGSVGLTTRDVEWFTELYCAPERRGEAAASPVRAPDFAGLPPSLIVLAEQDVLYDEGRHVAGRLDAAGIPVTLIAVAGVNHGFMSTDLGLESIPEVFGRIHAWLAPLIAD